jgi:CHAT domain-containing protein
MVTAQRLGRVLLQEGAWQRAGLAYASAREAFALLFGQGLDEAEARALIAGAGPMFAEAAFGALQRGETEAALDLASQGRAQMMTIALRMQTLQLPADQRRRLDDLRGAIRFEQQDVEAAQGMERAAALERLATRRRELLALLKDNGQAGLERGAALAQARQAAADGIVIMPVVTGFGGKIFIVTDATDGGLGVIDAPELTTQRLSELLIGPDDGPPAGWIGAYFINYMDAADREERWPEWLAAIDGLGASLWQLIGARLDAALKQRGVTPGARLVWLPSGWLGTVPLGLAQDPVTKRRLADAYEIVYAPSLEVLAAAYRSPPPASPATLAVVINPTGDLPGTETEGAVVASHFPSRARTLLQRDEATPEAVLGALRGRTYWHFASHGTFTWSDPRQSGLVLHGLARLSVGRLLETDGLGRPRLVVLSACETGLSEITSNPDEFLGLPGAFTALGAVGVLGTLWPVSDAATALLIARFYELHIGAGLVPAAALAGAQAWLREATNEELITYTRAATAKGRLENRQLADIERALSAEALARSRNRSVVEWTAPDGQRAGGAATGTPGQVARPFAHPYFWAGFIYTGI